MTVFLAYSYLVYTLGIKEVTEKHNQSIPDKKKWKKLKMFFSHGTAWEIK